MSKLCVADASCLGGVVERVYFFLAEEVTIVEQPQSLNITSGSDAHFTCKARAHIVQWRANGSVIDSDFAHSYSDGPIRISNLTLPADQVHKYNRARITCVAGSRTTASVESEPAFLLIQGKRERFLVLFTTICTHAHVRTEFHEHTANLELKTLRKKNL